MDALRLLKVDVEMIEEQLELGYTLVEVLTRGQQGVFYEHLRFFLKIMPFEHAIESASSLSGFEKDIKMKLVKKSMYPLCILLFAYIMLWVFTTTVIPQMMSSFSQDESFMTLSHVVTCIRVFCVLTAIVSLLVICAGLYLKLHKRVCIALLKRHQCSLIKNYETYLFSGYLVEMDRHGVSTQHAMKFFQTMRRDTLFYEITQDVNTSLNKGEGFYKALQISGWFNDGFLMSFRIALATGNLHAILTSFMTQQMHMWNRSIRKAGIIIQSVSYVFVALVVLIVYQIMLVPLGMLEQM